jgi:glycosyltransferase involved in cell wall biosynthesis
VLTRAFACATPVVASDISGYRGVMEPEAGRLVPPDDPATLANVVTELLADEPARQGLGRAARAIAEERYSWDRIAVRLAEIYESLVESQSAVAA